jgi:hypothetical protein
MVMPSEESAPISFEILRKIKGKIRNYSYQFHAAWFVFANVEKEMLEMNPPLRTSKARILSGQPRAKQSSLPLLSSTGFQPVSAPHSPQRHN